MHPHLAPRNAPERAPPIAPQKSRASLRRGAGSNGDASVKRRIGVHTVVEHTVVERRVEHAVEQGAASVRVERDGRERGTAAPITITWRAATALPTAAARATTRRLYASSTLRRIRMRSITSCTGLAQELWNCEVSDFCDQNFVCEQ